MVMQASGGVMTKEYIDGAPIRVLASGPAGGVIGSAHVGSAKGFPNLLCVDMGGTSYDMSVVLNGAAPAETGWNMHHRYLVGVPMVQEIGRASCRERVCQYVWISVVAVTLKKKQIKR